MSHDPSLDTAQRPCVPAGSTRRAALLTAAIVMMGLVCCAMAADGGQSRSGDDQGKGLAAIARAEEEGKHTFLFFYKADDEQTAAMRKVFDKAMAKASDKAIPVVVKVTDPAEGKLVARYKVQRAPMPLVLALAPNGAITGGFPLQFNQETLLGAFVSPSMAKCLKAIQAGKVVIACVRGKSAASNEKAIRAAKGFKADVRFTRWTSIVEIDAADAKERRLVKLLRVDPETDQAVTVMLAPPGTVIGSIKGVEDKEALVKAFVAATSSACGPGGCGPGGCK